MNLSERIVSDYEQTIQTDFWKMFISSIGERRKLLSKDCETKVDMESIRYAQGGVKILDWILGVNEQQPLIERLLLKLRDQKKQGDKRTI